MVPPYIACIAFLSFGEYCILTASYRPFTSKSFFSPNPDSSSEDVDSNGFPFSTFEEVTIIANHNHFSFVTPVLFLNFY